MNVYPHSNDHAVIVVQTIWMFLLVLAAVPAGADVHLTDVDPASGVAGQFLGGSIAVIPDLNSDGRDELLIGIPGDSRAGTNAGAVFFWYGGRELTEAPDRIWTGLEAERLGTIVAHVGDLNDDGRADFALGAPWYALNRGRVLVFHGAATLPASGSAQTMADREILGENGGDQFGFAVAGAGNFNGDNGGYADMIVGAPFSFGGRGSAYVLFGASGGVSENLADATAMAGQFAGNYFGWSVTGAGDFLGGNAESVAVGAPRYTLYGLDAGAVFVYEGTLGGAKPDTTIKKILRPDIANRANALYGFVVRGGGNWDGDGFTDIAVGGPGANDGSGIRGRVEIHLGSASVNGVGDQWLEGAAALDSLGYSLDWVYEPGSSSSDLVVGAPFSNAQDDQGNGTSDGGRAYRWTSSDGSGGVAGVEQLPVTPMVPGIAGGDHYGAWVASAGDFNGDGQADLAIGAPTGNIGNNAVAGYVHLRDSADLVVPNLLAYWRSSWAPGGGAQLEFDLSLSLHEVAALDIVRLDVEGRHEVWTGPALASEAGPSGGLVADGSGYHLFDPAAPTGSRYDVTVHLQDGSSATLIDLYGPAGAVPAAGADLELGAPWPNPANPMVTIRFRAKVGRDIALAIHDLRGRLVRRLTTVRATGAWQEATWDGRTTGGAPAASGVYLIRVGSGAEVRNARVTLAR